MSEAKTYFIGWDVGGWNCDKNRNSQDSVCVLGHDEQLVVEGEVKRGNLRDALNKYSDLRLIVNEFCETEITDNDKFFLAIDTPLGFSVDFRNLVASRAMTTAPVDGAYNENPYLYRETERWLFDNGYPPLSAIKDMIGSQATKGMHLLSKIKATTNANQVGKWTNETVTAVEAYPTTCKSSNVMANLRASLPLDGLRHDDQFDAVYCALVAYLLASAPDKLVGPPIGVDHEEGWIWVPADSINNEGKVE
jgi:predicted RNase H-like nuclease